MVERSCTVYSIEYKMSAVKAYLESGEPIKQFCRENNIKYQTFYGWLDKYNKSSEEEKKQLYEITVPLKSLSNKATEIEEYIFFYNNYRFQKNIKGMTPNEVRYHANCNFIYF